MNRSLQTTSPHSLGKMHYHILLAKGCDTSDPYRFNFFTTVFVRQSLLESALVRCYHFEDAVEVGEA